MWCNVPETLNPNTRWIVPSSVLLCDVCWFETEEPWTFWPLKMGLICCPETSVSYHLTPYNNREDKSNSVQPWWKPMMSPNVTYFQSIWLFSCLSVYLVTTIKIYCCLCLRAMCNSKDPSWTDERTTTTTGRVNYDSSQEWEVRACSATTSDTVLIIQRYINFYSVLCIKDEHTLIQYLTENIKWNVHIEHLSNILNGSYYIIKSLKDFTSINILRSMYFAHFYSYFRYGILFWGRWYTKNKDF
jgi:hypothetical protein